MKNMTHESITVAKPTETKENPAIKKRTVPVLSDARKKLFSAIETSTEFGVDAFYGRYSNLKKSS